MREKQNKGCEIILDKRVRTESVIAFKKSDSKQQIVFGEVYVPNRRDTDGNFMTAETVEKMAHDFMLNKHFNPRYREESDESYR